MVLDASAKTRQNSGNFLKMLMLCIICIESSGSLILSLDYLHEFWSLKYTYNYYLFKMYTTLKNNLVNPWIAAKEKHRRKNTMPSYLAGGLSNTLQNQHDGKMLEPGNPLS